MRLSIIIIFITSAKILAFKDEVCPAISSAKYEIQWPTATNMTISNPPCLNEKKEFLYRECRNGEWKKEPECASVQMKTLPQCPEEYIEGDTFCYTIIKNSQFPPKCPFDNVLPFEVYKDKIGTEFKGPVWMPVKRDLSNGLGFLQWTEYSTLHRTDFDGSYYYGGRIKEKDCLLYFNSSYILAVSCDEEYPVVCAYEKLHQEVPRLCGVENKCQQSGLSAKSKCVCVGTLEQADYPLVEFLEPYQNNISRLTNQSCGTSLRRISNGTYIWNGSKKGIDYSFWSKDVIFDIDHIYGVSTSNGWILTKQPSQCILFEKTLEQATPRLVLEYNNHFFKLTIHDFLGLKFLDSNILINCFTNAFPTSLIYIYKNLTFDFRTKNYILFQMYEEGPGDYWCESFKFDESEIVRSNQVSLRNRAEFVVVVKMRYNDSVNPLSPDIVEVLKSSLFSHFDANDYLKTNYIYRLMKIADLDEDEQVIWINIHFTASSQISLEPEYERMKNILDVVLGTLIDIEIVDFSSSDYCFAEISRNLSWPTTAAGFETTSSEYCFKSDGTLLTRFCVEDFIDGAYWENILENCSSPDKSSITDDILSSIIGNRSLENIHIISQKYANFNSFDVYLISFIFANSVPSCISEVSLSVEIINNLLQVDKYIIAESHRIQATKTILNFFKMILGSVFFLQIETFGNHFGLAISQLSNLKGLLVLREPNTLNITNIRDINITEDILELKNLDSAIWLDSDLINEIEKDQTIMFTRLSKDSFFVDNSTKAKNVTNIFGFIIPGNRSYSGSVSILYNLQRIEKSLIVVCAFWNFDEEIWVNGTEITSNGTFLFCKFSPGGFYSLLTFRANENEEENSHGMTVWEWITLINCSLSFLGLCCIFITAVFFRSWRRKTGNRILLNFSFAILLQIVMLYPSHYVRETGGYISCIVIGSILHFAFLSGFCWMLVFGILQFRRYVVVFVETPRSFLLKIYFFSWVCPCIPVVCVLITNHATYLHGGSNLCYPSGFYLYFGVWLPATVIIAINFIIFLSIIYNVVKIKPNCANSRKDLVYQWRLGILLFLSLGFTWIFGLLMDLNCGPIFYSLYAITATLQGFMMFLFFIAFNSSTRSLYFHAIKRRWNFKKTQEM